MGEKIAPIGDLEAGGRFSVAGVNYGRVERLVADNQTGQRLIQVQISAAHNKIYTEFVKASMEVARLRDIRVCANTARVMDWR